MSKVESEEKSLEEKLNALDEIIAKLQDDDAPLETAFALYSQGIELVRECNKSIDKVDKKVQLLMDDGSTEAFE